MKRIPLSISTLLAFGLVAFAGCGKKAEQTKSAQNGSAGAPAAPAALNTLDQKVSYGIGYRMGGQLPRQGLSLDQAAFLAGITDGSSSDGKLRIPEADLSAAFMEFSQKLAAARAAEGEKQLAAGKAYLEKNKAKPGVKVTDTGLQYEVLKSGTGPKPTKTNTVKVHYHGTLIDGKVFDSSVERNEPIEFPVTGVIPGWVEALQLMSVGDKWKLTIPGDIAYGAHGKGDIPPNAVLIFEVELLGIK